MPRSTSHKQAVSQAQRPIRNASIDILRGWLMVFVIVGHVVLGSVHDNVIRYSIYAFHMPLFIGLSGYLINPASLGNSSLWSVMQRYWHRVLLPFSVAFVCFTGVLVFHANEEGRLSSQLIVSYLTTPYYHLWFIPTLVIWVLTYWIALKIKFPLSVILAVCVIASFIWASIANDRLVALLSLLMSKKVVYFFLFFVLGAVLRKWADGGFNNKLLTVLSDFKVLPTSIIIGCAMVYLLNIGIDKSPLRAAVWLMMNMLLIVICTNLMTERPTSKRRTKKLTQFQVTLQDMGRNSLPIYLWHVAPLFILKGLDVHQTQVWWYYLISISVIIAIVVAILRLENKSAFINKIVFGRG